MKVSIPKTKSMVISKELIRCKLAIDDQLIEQVFSFNYLDINTSSSRDVTKEVRSQVNRASIISGCLRDIIWRNKFISTENKVRIYKCVPDINIRGRNKGGKFQNQTNSKSH